eukprot:TRINITY_DN4144_c0_g1_i3.p1 TRINITY_DN4144_c0_g1~~TRINITY_DN4144_c0_g1_i3.p1  ORF type:complete len:296 (+),score=57.38 TRINITY_DN4144_c0_g1_i3:76-963(+)
MGMCTGVNSCCGQNGRFGEYEFAEIDADFPGRLTLTANQTINKVLVKYIRSTAKRIALSLGGDGTSKRPEQPDFAGTLVRLRVVSGHMLAGSELVVAPQGYEAGSRNKKDGAAYFGCKKRSCKSAIRLRHSEIVNDVVIKLRDKSIAEMYRGPHFRIRYKSGSYWIKDLGIGFGTFLKVSDPLLIRDGSLIMFGDSFLLLNLLPDVPLHKKEGAHLRLKVTVYAGPANGEILYLCVTHSYFSTVKSIVNIGRLNSCEIQITDTMMSKNQAQILLADKGWTLHDGFGGRPSTNGTW